MNKEMVERIALVFNGCSWGSEYEKRWTVRNIVRALGALTRDDLNALLVDVDAIERSKILGGERVK